MEALRARALDLARGQRPVPKAIDRVASETTPEAARWAFLQWELRRRGAAKFEAADSMLFTREALEQATHEAVAAYRASRFPEGARVVDLTCSIGADLIALARRGPAVGVDLDAERLECAAHNLEVHGLSAEVRLEDAFEATRDADYAIADPDRRPGGRRSLQLASFSPDPVALAQVFVGLELGCLKLSPALSDESLRELGGAVEFWSYDGECREAAVWFGSSLSQSYCAVKVESGERLDARGEPPSGAADAFLFEADPAAIRAHALGTLSQRHDLAALGDKPGYLTGPDLVVSPWLKAYRVLSEPIASVRMVGERLKELGFGTPVVKSRLEGAVPIALAKRWRQQGDRPGLVACYAERRSPRFLIVQPVDLP